MTYRLKADMVQVEEAIRFLESEGCFHFAECLTDLIEDLEGVYSENVKLKQAVDQLQTRLYLHKIDHSIEGSTDEAR